MTDRATDDDNRGLVIEIEGEQVSFALAELNGRLDLLSVAHYRTSDFSTLTECVSAFASQAKVALTGRDCAICISGAVTGDILRIARCRWIISVNGLRHITGRPPIVVNDSVALAWGTLSPKPSLTRALGISGTPNLTQAGRWLTVNRRTGLGAAVLSIDQDGQTHVGASEIGHTAFAPETEAEHSLAAYLGKNSRRVSWEMALAAIADPPADWTINGMRPDRTRCESIHAEMLGAFAGDAALAMAAWNGVFLHGPGVQFLSTINHVAEFVRRFEDKGFYRGSMRTIPRWLINDPQAALVGNALLLANHIKNRALA